MKKLIFALAILLATPAAAKDVTITLNDQEQKAFLAILDIALKQGGLQSLGAVSTFAAKIQAAMQAANPPAPPAPSQPEPVKPDEKK